MKSILTLICAISALTALGQSSSAHYTSNIRGSLTSGNISTSAHVEATTVSIWTEGHEQTSRSYSNASVATQNQQQTSGIKRLMVSDIKLSIYPNPSHDLFNISTDLSEIVVVVRDLTGKEIFRQTSTSPISSFNWEQGVYLITVTSGNISATTKVLKL